MSDAVSRALAAVPRERYTSPAAGGFEAPDAAAGAGGPDPVERGLREAGIGTGMRVLEIGTGTGYTSALLAELVGVDGLVVSVDVDAARTDRAAALHAEPGVGAVLLSTSDGRLGLPEHQPYDAVLAWASPEEVPAAWVRQCRAGAVVRTPVYLAPVAGAVGYLRASVARTCQDGGPAGHADLAGSAGPVGPDGQSGPDSQLVQPRLTAAWPGTPDIDAVRNGHAGGGVPTRYLDASAPLDGGVTAWVSTAWRGQYPGHDPCDTLAMLVEPAHTEPVVLAGSAPEPTAAWRDFLAYCTGRDPSNLTTFGTTGRSPILAVGFSSGLNAAVLTSDGRFIANGMDSPALTKVRDYFDEWEKAGRPGVDTLRAVLRATGTGWQVRTTPMRLARRAVRK